MLKGSAFKWINEIVENFKISLNDFIGIRNSKIILIHYKNLT